MGKISTPWMGLLLGLCVATSATMMPTPLRSENVFSDAQAALRLNIAGRQRMLTQRMSKAACLAVSGVDVELQRGIAVSAADEFDTNLAFLRFGDDRAPGENDPVVRDALSVVADLAPPLTASTRQLAAGDLHSIVMSIMISSNLPALDRSDEVVSMIATVSLPERYANTVNLAGRQRMLSQRIAKTMCFVVMNLAPEASLQELIAAADLFEKTLDALKTGAPDQNLLPPPTPAVAAQLERANQSWAAVAPVVQQFAEGEEVSVDQLQAQIAYLDQILADMDHAVRLWTEYSGTSG